MQIVKKLMLLFAACRIGWWVRILRLATEGGQERAGASRVDRHQTGPICVRRDFPIHTLEPKTNYPDRNKAVSDGAIAFHLSSQVQARIAKYDYGVFQWVCPSIL